jgi:hypothetical protein
MSRIQTEQFNVEDPFRTVDLREGLLPPPPIVRVEGWQHHVRGNRATKPSMPSEKEFAAFTVQEKRGFAKLRKNYHAEMPLIETPTLAKVHSEAMGLAARNYRAAAGARMGIVLDGLGTVGKSSIAAELGRKYELSWRKTILPQLEKHGGFLNPIPVIYVTLPGVIAISDFNRLITSFMGISVPVSAKIPWLNDRIIDATQACGTSLIIIDDIHFLQMRNRSAQLVNNHLKYLANCVSATFVYAGINVEGSGLLAEGKSKEKAFASQTQHRFKTFPIRPFAKTSGDLKPLLSAFEANLALMNQKPGTLEIMSDFIHDRTGGFMGAISNLLREGANAAIDAGSEELTRPLLQKVKLGFASEAHQKTTISKNALATT